MYFSLIIQKNNPWKSEYITEKEHNNLSIKHLYEITICKVWQKCTLRTCGYLKKKKKTEKNTTRFCRTNVMSPPGGTKQGTIGKTTYLESLYK